MDEFGPVNRLTDGFEMVVNFFEDDRLSKNYDSMVRHDVKRQNLVIFFGSYNNFLSNGAFTML